MVPAKGARACPFITTRLRQTGIWFVYLTSVSGDTTHDHSTTAGGARRDSPTKRDFTGDLNDVRQIRLNSRLAGTSLSTLQQAQTSNILSIASDVMPAGRTYSEKR